MFRFEKRALHSARFIGTKFEEHAEVFWIMSNGPIFRNMNHLVNKCRVRDRVDVFRVQQHERRHCSSADSSIPKSLSECIAGHLTDNDPQYARESRSHVFTRLSEFINV